jgi:DNA-binding response OmpR family regulator
MTLASRVHGAHAAVLVVSPSSVLRELLRRILLLHGYEVGLAGSCEEALDDAERRPGLALLLCDAALPDGSGLDLLRAVRQRARPAPDAILITGRPDVDEARRARELGAIGYLAKPIAFRDIARALYARAGSLADRPPRRRHVGRACPVDAASEGEHVPQVLWLLRDVSTTGAFLDTDAPVPVGTKLQLALELGPTRIRVQAEVVRVQEPAWGRSGGIGVTFADLSPDGRALLDAFVAAGADDPA